MIRDPTTGTVYEIAMVYSAGECLDARADFDSDLVADGRMRAIFRGSTARQCAVLGKATNQERRLATRQARQLEKLGDRGRRGGL